MQAKDFLTVAEHLYQQEGEVFKRSAASRAYYCAFHVCQNIADTQQLPPAQNRNTGSHQQLIKRLLHSDNKRLNKLGTVLRQGRDLRTEADYKLSSTFSKENAFKSLQFATFIAEHIEQL